MKLSDVIVGIDLGTTNSLVGVIEKGRPRLFNGEDNQTLIPSVVSIDPSGSIEVGAAAKAKKTTAPERTLYSVKRFIGRGKQDVTEWMRILPFDFSPSDDQMVRFRVGGTDVTPIEISAAILRKLKELSQAALGHDVKKAVVTVPAYFNDAQRQATKFAAELAGLEVMRIVNEPTAACLAYGLDKKTSGNIAVFDLGGGTFDISILRVSEGVFEVLATNGNTALGGDDFDHAIVKQVAPGVTSSQARAELIVEAERVKRALSTESSITFRASGIEREITRAEFESWIEPILMGAEGPCRQCLADAGLKPSQITDVILVGGSTRVPRVVELVRRLFGREPIASLNPDEVVAMGACVQANILMGQMGGMLLLDVIPLSLGIEMVGGVVGRIIHRNSTIPISASETYTTYVDGQISVDIHVVQGERELVKDNRSLARFQLKGLPPLPAGIPKIEVEFIVDANGILSVRALELRTGTMASIRVNPSYGLSDSQVEQMLMDSFENAEQDFAARFLAEARTEGDGLVRAARKSLQKGRHLVNEQELTQIESAISALETSLSQTSHSPIRASIDKLNEVTRPLAEKLLNDAVNDAMKDKSMIVEEKP